MANEIIDLRDYKPTLLERALSLDAARSLAGQMMTDPLMALSNAFITGLSYGRRKVTDKERKRMEAALREVMDRIEVCDRLAAQGSAAS